MEVWQAPRMSSSQSASLSLLFARAAARDLAVESHVRAAEKRFREEHGKDFTAQQRAGARVRGVQRLEHLGVEEPLRVYRELALVRDAARPQRAPQAPA